MTEKQQAILLSAAWGFAIWVIIGIAGGNNEAWDSPIYATAGVPMLAIGAAVLGWSFPVFGWRCGFMIAAGHALGMIVTTIQNGLGLGLIPFTIILLLILSLPLLLASAIGAFLKRKKMQDAGKP